MSFSSRVKEELSRHQVAARHCQIAEIAAIISMCGGVSISEKNHYRLKIQTENLYVARKYFTLLQKAFNIEVEVSVRQSTFSKSSLMYTVAVLEHDAAVRTTWSYRRPAVNVLLSEGLLWQRVRSVIRRNFII